MRITKTEVFELKECLSIYFTSVSGSFLLRCQMERFSMRERERERYIYKLYIFYVYWSFLWFKPRAICGTYLVRVCNDILVGRLLVVSSLGWICYVQTFFAQQLYAAWTRTRSLRRSKFILHILYIQYAFVLTAFIFIKLVIKHNITRVWPTIDCFRVVVACVWGRWYPNVAPWIV